MFAPLIGYALDTGSVCSAVPAPVPAFVSKNLLDTIADKLAYLNSVMWYSLCECVPGTPTPVTPTPPTLTQPTDWPSYGPYPCTNSDICATLIQILHRLDDLGMGNSVRIDQRTTVVTTPVPLAYKIGATHNLSGSGSFAVSNLVGLRLQITSTPTHILPGTPAYLWDQGWMSVTDGGAMLQEKRITRANAEWFPAEMTLATLFGYYLNPGVTGTMTELQPA
jgi:hypothetical protein